VLNRLGLTPRGGRPPLTQSYGWRGDQMLRLPANASTLVRTELLGFRSKAQVGRLLARIDRIDPEPLAGLSLGGWIQGLGLRADAEELVISLARTATYAADLERLSADAGVRQLQRAMTAGVEYLDGGWQQVVDGLTQVAEQRGVRVRTGARLTRVQPADDSRGGWTATFDDPHHGSRQVQAASVVLAVGSPAAGAAVLGVEATVLGWDAASVGPELTAACLDLGLRRPPDRPFVLGLGPDRPLFLTTHAPTARLAAPGQGVVHVLRYGARDASADRAQLGELVAAAGIDQADVIVDRFLHRMVVAHGAPQPGAGLAGRPPVTVVDRPGLFVTGDWVGPAGLLADASLASAEVAGRLASAHAAAELLSTP